MCNDNKIEIFKGDSTKTISIVIKENGVPRDITNDIVFFTVKNRFDDVEDDSSAVIKITNTTHLDPLLGITSFSFTNEQTEIEAKTYVYDIKIRLNGTGSILTFLVGEFEVLNNVTRRFTDV